MMRARKTYGYYWNKLRRLLGCLKQTIKLPLILRADGVNMINWWVGALYAAHDNMLEHTVGTMTMVKKMGADQ